MNDHNLPPGDSLQNEQGEDNNLNGPDPDFDFKKFNIGIDDIQNNVHDLIELGERVQNSQENRFPIECFPLKIQQIIKATNETLDYPVDFTAASMIYAASIAIGNTHWVEVRNGWQDNAVIYLAIAAPPGTNKSHPLTFALQPIVEKDKKTYNLYEKEQKEYEHTLNLSRGNRKSQPDVEPVKPFWKKHLVSDFTPEALAEVHKYNKRGIGVYVDELATWFKNFNRYNKGSEMEFWLSNWSHKPINIDRKTGEPIYIAYPFIPVAGTIQSGLLTELAKDNRTQNGFMDRILFVILPELQKPYWSETELDPSFIQDWNNIILKLLELTITFDETSNPCPEIIMFTSEAKRALFDWQIRNADEINSAENESIKGIYSKFEIYVVRLALILEMIRFACDESDKKSVSIEAMLGAIKLVEYFKNSAIKVNSIISNHNPLDKFPANKRKIYEALPDTFSTQEGLIIASANNLSERSFKEFLKEKELFNKIRHGQYDKLL